METVESKLSVSISTVDKNSDGVNALRERHTQITLLQSFAREHIGLMQTDLEFLTRIAKHYPDDVLAVHNRIINHDYSGARELARGIGLTEENLSSEGGDQWGLVIIIAIAAAVLLEHD